MRDEADPMEFHHNIQNTGQFNNDKLLDILHTILFLIFYLVVIRPQWLTEVE